MATVNATDHGVVADWVPAMGGGSGTDNRAAMMAAIAAAGPGGTVVCNWTGNVGVVVDASNYLYLDKNGITLRGLSETDTKLYPVRPSTNDGIGLYRPAGIDVFLQDLKIVGNGRDGYFTAFSEQGSGKWDLTRVRIETVYEGFRIDPGGSFYARNSRLSAENQCVLVSGGGGSPIVDIRSTHVETTAVSTGFEHCLYLPEESQIYLYDIDVDRCGGYGFHMFGGLRDDYKSIEVARCRFANCFAAMICDYGRPYIHDIDIVCGGSVAASYGILIQNTQKGTRLHDVRISGTAGNYGIAHSGIGTRGAWLDAERLDINGDFGVSALARVNTSGRGLWTVFQSRIRNISATGGAFLQDAENLNVETWLDRCRLESGAVEAATVHGGKVRFLDCTASQVSILSAFTGPVEWEYTPETNLVPGTISGSFPRTLRPFNPGAGVGHYRARGA